MIKQLTIFAIILFSTIQVNAQRGHAIYAELLGGGLFYSVNYDTRFSESTDKLGGRIGISLYDNVMIAPIHVNYLLGANSHKLEDRFQKEDGKFLFRAGLSPTFVPVNEDELYGDIGKIFWAWPGVSFGFTL